MSSLPVTVGSIFRCCVG